MMKPSSTASGVAAAASGEESKGGHDNHLGIILGVVLGVLALLALLGLLWWIRRRRKRELAPAELLSTTERSPSLNGNGETNKAVATHGSSDHERPMSTLGPLTLPPILIRGPNTRTTTQTSTNTSVDQPFYTPSEGPSFFTDHNATELSAAPLPEIASVTQGNDSTQTSSDRRLPTSTSPYQTNVPYTTPFQADDNPNHEHNPHTSRDGQVIEDAGIGFTSINTGQTTPPAVAQVVPGTSFYDPNLSGDDISHREARNDHARVGSLLVASQDFTARRSDEITMAKGDRIVLVEKDEVSGG